ncbi:MAG: AMP-binding protein [Thermodesulfobacteriota bacterium]|nr:AMP-binding protein [Thermodesulfobacteriota bacterium]
MTFYDDISAYSNHTAIVTEQSTQISYKMLLSVADGIGTHIKERCLVFLLCRNCLESVAGYVGILRARAVPVLINEAIDTSFLTNLMEAYHPEYVFAPTDTQKATYARTPLYSFDHYTLAKTGYTGESQCDDQLALLLMTSGSTGSPRFVRQSYKNINSNAEAISQYLQIEAADRPITTMPMNYTYGLSIINSHLLNGASIVLTQDTLMNRKFWDLMKAHSVTTFGGVPYIYEMLKKLRFERMELPALKYLTQAGGRLSPELSARFADYCNHKSIRFIVMYGQTEATARMAYLPWEHARTKVGSVGMPIPGGNFWLEDDSGKRIPGSHRPGELVYQGDNVTMGYAENRQDLCKGDDNGGILHTGDMAKRDEDGFYYIVGRKNRFLKMFGHRVSLDEVEQLVRTVGYDCACTGVDDNLNIYLTKPDDNDKVKNLVIHRMGINQAGFSIIPIDDLPWNEAGKVMYSALN